MACVNSIEINCPHVKTTVEAICMCEVSWCFSCCDHGGSTLPSHIGGARSLLVHAGVMVCRLVGSFQESRALHS